MQEPCWQPIETAPLDGTPVLGYCEGEMAVVSYHAGDDLMPWQLTQTGSFAHDGFWTPSHWMPLPPPPRNREGTD